MNQTGTDSELQRRLELLAGKALGDLTDQEQLDVDELLQQPQWQSALWQLEATAAAVDLRLRPEQRPPMPLDLIKLIQNDAASFFSNTEENIERFETSSLPNSAPSPTSNPTPCPTPNLLTTGGLSDSQPSAVDHLSSDRRDASQQSTSATATFTNSSLEKQSHSASRREWLGWICCAASLLLAWGLWSVNRRPVETASAATQRNTLLASAADIVQIDWAAGTTPFSAEVVGDVVWSTEQQLGFMRFRGMPVNDPTVEQYQLWIIDPERDEQPIDGGVFDISESGEVIVPIDAKLKVNAPKAFAITIEQPGGVVVSDQSRLPLLAAVE